VGVRVFKCERRRMVMREFMMMMMMMMESKKRENCLLNVLNEQLI
jgi:hypothetical protein